MELCFVLWSPRGVNNSLDNKSEHFFESMSSSRKPEYHQKNKTHRNLSGNTSCSPQQAFVSRFSRLSWKQIQAVRPDNFDHEGSKPDRMLAGKKGWFTKIKQEVIPSCLSKTKKKEEKKVTNLDPFSQHAAPANCYLLLAYLCCQFTLVQFYVDTH